MSKPHVLGSTRKGGYSVNRLCALDRGAMFDETRKRVVVVDTDLYDVQFTSLGTDGTRGWLVSYPDLPGCYAHGRTKAEAFEKGADAIRLWIKMCEERGIAVPAPNSANLPSGHIRVRVPKTLQKRLLHLARHADTSINGFVVDLIQEGLTLLESNNVDDDNAREAVATSLESISSARDTLLQILIWDRNDYDSYSGEWNQRLEPHLHHQLRFRSEEQGVSINALIACLISLGVGRREGVLLSSRQVAPTGPVNGPGASKPKEAA